MKLIVGNLAINYLDEGSGPIILLLHGWGINLGTFEQLSADLKSKYRVIRLDFPGFGNSQKPPDDWGVGEYAALVKDFLLKLKLEPDVIIGHSFGGRVAIKAVGQSLIKPNKLILLDSAGVSETKTLRNQGFKALAKIGKSVTNLPFLSALRRPMRSRLYRSAGSTDYLNAGAMTKIFLNTIREDLQVDAAKIAVSTLLIWGGDDSVTPVDIGQKLANKIRGSKLEIIPEANHFVYLDQPDKTYAFIREFIK